MLVHAVTMSPKCHKFNVSALSLTLSLTLACMMHDFLPGADTDIIMPTTAYNLSAGKIVLKVWVELPWDQFSAYNSKVA